MFVFVNLHFQTSVMKLFPMFRTSHHGLHRALLLIAIFISSPRLLAQDYPLPQVPDSILSVNARANYVVERFWQHYDFADTTLLGTLYAEQALANYLTMLTYADDGPRNASIAHFAEACRSNRQAEQYFFKTTERYLYYNDSPLRNEPIYLQMLSRFMLSDDEGIRLRSQYMLGLVGRNMPGTMVSNCQLRLPDESLTTLHSLLPQSGACIVVFYDPDCETCLSTLFRLKYSVPLRNAISQGRLRLIAIYAEGDEKQWRETLGEMPKNWTVAMDTGDVREQSLFDLKSMPTLLLLKANGEVVIKDATFKELEQHLLNTAQ